MLVQQNNIELLKHIDKVVDALDHCSDDLSGIHKRKMDVEKLNFTHMAVIETKDDLQNVIAQLTHSAYSLSISDIGDKLYGIILAVYRNQTSSTKSNAIHIMMDTIPYSQFWIIALDFITESLWAIKSECNLMEEIAKNGLVYLTQDKSVSMEQLLQSVFVQCVKKYDYLFQDASEVCIHTINQTLVIDPTHDRIPNPTYREFTTMLNDAMSQVMRSDVRARSILLNKLVYKQPIYHIHIGLSSTNTEDYQSLMQSMHRHTNVLLCYIKNLFDYSDALNQCTHVRCRRCTPTDRCSNCKDRCHHIVRNAHRIIYRAHANEIGKMFSPSLFLYS